MHVLVFTKALLIVISSGGSLSSFVSSKCKAGIKLFGDKGGQSVGGGREGVILCYQARTCNLESELPEPVCVAVYTGDGRRLL